MKAVAYRMDRAANLDDVFNQLQQDEFFKVIAGGQSLGAMLNLRLAQPECVVDLDALDSLREVHLSNGELSLGAMTTHAAIEDVRVPDVTLGMLASVAHGIAYRAVRNRGTIGGSLCHADPAADWITAMAVVGAICEVRGPQGTREVPAAQFMASPFEPALNPGEILLRVRVPAFGANARWSYRKHCRKVGEFAMAIVSGVADPARGVERLVLGALDCPPHVIERPGLFRELGDAQARHALLQEPALSLPSQHLALFTDLLATVVADIGTPS